MDNLFFEGGAPAPAPVILRPYQESMVNAWMAFMDKGLHRGLIVAATGSGKTVLFNAIIRAMAEKDPGYTFLALAHRKELLEQIKETAEWVNPHLPCSIHSGDSKGVPGSSIVAGSVQSLGRTGTNALDWLGPKLVIADEAHHAVANTYQCTFNRFGCYDPAQGTYLLGVTATPHRLDNKALVGGCSKAIFEEIVFRYDITAAIKDGFLVDLKGYRASSNIDLSKVKVQHGDYRQDELEDVMNVDHVNQLAYESWLKEGKDHQTIVFCSGVDHAKAVAEVFRAKGVKAAAIWGDMPRKDRDQTIQDFREGYIKVLTNMDILTEGFDARQAGCVILLRPTKSWALFVQMIGRGLRTLPGVIEGLEFQPSRDRRSAIKESAKPECIVIDIVAIGGEDGHNAAAKHDGSGTPSLNALVGLPEGLDLEGHSVIEALEQFEELPEIVQGAATRKKVLKFSDLNTVMSQVQMMSEIEPPEEAVMNGELYWLKVGDGRYFLDCGSQGGVERKAEITRDILGYFTLTIASTFRDPKVFDIGDDIAIAFRRAEAYINKEFIGVSALASRKSAWRVGVPTVPQINLLKAMGVEPEIIANLTKSTASAMITLLKARKEQK